jgi:hypothetical protein
MKNRFIDTNYRTLFELEDGDKVRITYPDGKTVDSTVQGCGDEYHIRLDGRVYHICQFAEIMEHNGCVYAPTVRTDKLPDFCYSMLQSTQEWILVKRNVKGYFQTNWGKTTQEAVEQINRKLGVTKAESLAMEFGSMFGWDKPGADPALYEDVRINDKAEKPVNGLEVAYKQTQRERGMKPGREGLER